MITIKLQAFEGPFDLLFHLIEKNKMNIYDIPISELTDQYIAHMQIASSDENMESMSRFLYMAATLLEIKSRMLLPVLPKDGQPAGENAADPREELVARLIEYKQFKNAAEFLKEQEVEGTRYIYRNIGETLPFFASPQNAVTVEELLEGVTPPALFRLFQDILRRRELKVDKIRSSFDSVQKDVFTIKEKIDFIRKLLTCNRSLRFMEVFRASIDRMEKVVTFLAMLELIKVKEVQAEQGGAFEEILLKKCDPCISFAEGSNDLIRL